MYIKITEFIRLKSNMKGISQTINFAYVIFKNLPVNDSSIEIISFLLEKKKKKRIKNSLLPLIKKCISFRYA